MLGEDFSSKLPKFPPGDAPTNLGHQVLIETKVMDGQQRAGEHLGGQGQMAKVTARKVAAGIARAVRITRKKIYPSC